MGNGANQHYWNGRGHFFGAAAEAMRRILVERARHKNSLKAGGNRQREVMSFIEPDPADGLLDGNGRLLSNATDSLDPDNIRPGSVIGAYKLLAIGRNRRGWVW